MKFTLEQIHHAHSKVKSGADFPKYIQEIKALGVTAFETQVSDASTHYFGSNEYSISSPGMFAQQTIASKTDAEEFKKQLQSHQKGETDFSTFCRHCAQTGIVKWTVDLTRMTCTYFDAAQNEILVERVPSV